MKLNKKLLIIIGISIILLIGLFLAYNSSDNRPENTDTYLDVTSEENNDDKNDGSNNQQDSENNDSSNNEDINLGSSNAENNESSNTNGTNNNNNNNSNAGNNGNNNSNNTEIKDEANTGNATGNMDINEEGIYAVDNNYFDSLILDEKSVLKAATYLNNLQETYLSENNKVFYAVIPDKTYYDTKSSYDKLDYDKMTRILNENIKNMEYIKLKDLLSLDDYYRTDNHWKQQSIIDVANRIGGKLGFTINSNDFEKKSFMKFKGMYSKYITNSEKEEELQYLTNNYTKNATVDNYQNKDFTNVYEVGRLSTDIPYDIYLSGATPFLTITNSSAENDKELVIFRDSFASSISPLLISEYSKITLIDTRFMSSVLLKDFIEFDTQDVLFLYSSAVINNSNMLK